MANRLKKIFLKSNLIGKYHTKQLSPFIKEVMSSKGMHALCSPY